MDPVYKQPFMFEDRTGNFKNTAYEDYHDRRFIGVSTYSAKPMPPSHGPYALRIVELRHRTSTFSPAFGAGETLVILTFGAGGALGSVHFIGKSDGISMSGWMRRVPHVPKARKFICSDNEEYIWSLQASLDCEWMCTNACGYVVASYHLKPPSEAYPRSSGNICSVEETYGHLCVELLAALTIMRHIKKHDLF